GHLPASKQFQWLSRNFRVWHAGCFICLQNQCQTRSGDL
ncbi:hypothetical protein, partial [Methylomonas albis]